MLLVQIRVHVQDRFVHYDSGYPVHPMQDEVPCWELSFRNVHG